MNTMKKIYKESDIRNDYKKLTKLLIERGMTITTMESATSGLIGSVKRSFCHLLQRSKNHAGRSCRDSGEVYGIFERDRRSNGEGLHKSV